MFSSSHFFLLFIQAASECAQLNRLQTAATVTFLVVTKATCAECNLVIPGAAVHGAYTPRERPSFSTRRPAGG